MASRIHADKLRREVEALEQQLASDPTVGLQRPRVSTRLVEDMTAESRFVQYDKPFEFRCDESVERSGQAAAPSPLRSFLSGVAFCQQVWYAKGAALVGCDLDDLTIDLETLLDMRGEHKVGDAPVHPQHVILEARVSSPSPAERVLAMVDEANSRCPLYNLVSRAIPVYNRIYHNDTLIRDTVPAPLASPSAGG
jgi:uncharacterized OsmC-like protein